MKENITVNSNGTIDFDARSFNRQKKVKTQEDKKKGFNEAVARLKRAIEKDGGRYIEFIDRDGGLNRGILLAGVQDGPDGKDEKDKRLYFAYLDKNRTIRRSYHGDTYRLLRDIPVEFGISDYLYRHEFKDFKQTVEDKLNATGWNILTKVALREPRHKPIDNKRGKHKDFKKGKKNDNSKKS